MRILLCPWKREGHSLVCLGNAGTGLCFSYNATFMRKTSIFLSICPYMGISSSPVNAQLCPVSLFFLAVTSQGKGEALKQQECKIILRDEKM